MNSKFLIHAWDLINAQTENLDDYGGQRGNCSSRAFNGDGVVVVPVPVLR